MSTEKKRAFIIEIVFIVVVLAIAYLCMRYLLVWLFPFLTGLVISYISQRPIKWISKHTKINIRIVSLVFVLFFIGIALFFLFFIGFRMIVELSGFIGQIPLWAQTGFSSLNFYFNDMLEGVALHFPAELAQQLSSLMLRIVNSLVDEVGTLSSSAVAWLANKATGIPNAVVTVIITIVASFYISLDYDNVVVFLRRQVPEKYKDISHNIKATIITSIFRMLKAYIVLMTITFIELAIGLTILNVPYSVFIAGIIAIVDVLPVLGTGTVLIPWALIMLIQGDYTFAIAIIVIYFIITIVRSVLEPRFVGRQIGLNPVVTLTMMYLGLQVLGLPGMLLFPITMIVIKAAQDANLISIWK